MTFADPERARARAERVDIVLDKLVHGEWTSRMGVEKAKEWGVGLHTVQEYVREASTVLKYLVLGDPEELRARLLAGIEDIRRRCLERKRAFVVQRGKDEQEVMEVDDPDLRTALASYDSVAKACGLIVEKRQEVPADKLPTPALIGEIESELAKLKAQVN